MFILPQDQIEEICNIMTFILKNPTVPVENIRERFHLTAAEYNMIYDLCMPLIRMKNGAEYWKVKYVSLKQMIGDRLRNEQKKSNELASDIWEIMEASKVGKHHPKESDELESA